MPTTDTTGAERAEFTFLNRQRKVRVDVRRLAARAALLAGLEPPPPAAVAVTIVGDRAIRRLNREFLSEDRPTDVLSFRLGRRSGEIVISAETAAANAPGYGHDAGDELFYLVVHGFLHLKGMRDLRESDRREMTRRQDRLFAAVLRREGSRR